MAKAGRIFLVGPMGSGKTTIGKILANNFKMSFYDTDLEIERRAGASVSWIFDLEGEEGFRNREENLLGEMTKLESIVLSTGGGVVIRQKNRQVLSNRGLVVYLRPSIDDLIMRISGDKKRPLLQVENPTQKIRQLTKERDPLYLDIADLVIDTHGLGVKLVVQRLTTQLSGLLSGHD